MNAGSIQRWFLVNERPRVTDLLCHNRMKQLCNSISSFLNNKVRHIKDTIASRFAGSIYNPFVFEGLHLSALWTSAPTVHSVHSRGSDEAAEHCTSQIVAQGLRANVRVETM